jgi:hypothetical protein
MNALALALPAQSQTEVDVRAAQEYAEGLNPIVLKRYASGKTACEALSSVFEGHPDPKLIQRNLDALLRCHGVNPSEGNRLLGGPPVLVGARFAGISEIRLLEYINQNLVPGTKLSVAEAVGAYAFAYKNDHPRDKTPIPPSTKPQARTVDSGVDPNKVEWFYSRKTVVRDTTPVPPSTKPRAKTVEPKKVERFDAPRPVVRGEVEVSITDATIGRVPFSTGGSSERNALIIRPLCRYKG